MLSFIIRYHDKCTPVIIITSGVGTAWAQSLKGHRCEGEGMWASRLLELEWYKEGLLNEGRVRKGGGVLIIYFHVAFTFSISFSPDSSPFFPSLNQVIGALSHVRLAAIPDKTIVTK